MNYLKCILLFIIFNVIAFTSFSQTIRFDKHYNSGIWAWGFRVLNIESKGYIVVGAESSDSITTWGMYDENPYVMRADTNGDSLWSKKLGGISWDYFRYGDTIGNNKLICIGNTQSYNSIDQYDYDIYIAKMNYDGDTLWTKVINEIPDSTLIPCSFAVASDHNYMLGGKQCAFASGIYSSFLMKLDTAGNKIWRRRYVNPYNNLLFGGIIETPDKGFLCPGTDVANYSSEYDKMTLFKVDSLGILKWTKYYFPGDSNFWVSNFKKTLDGNYLILGNAAPYQWGFPYLVKVNGNGDIIWKKVYNFGGPDQVARGLASCSDGSYVIAGCDDYGANISGYLMKVNFAGDSLWRRMFDTTSIAGFFDDVSQTKDHGFIISGEIYGYNPGGNSSLWLVKVDSLGLLVPLGIRELPFLTNAVLGNAYPNPATNQFTIETHVQDYKKSAALYLFNSIGKQVATYNLDHGDNRTMIDCSNLAADTYLYVLVVDGYNAGGKKVEVVK